MYVQNMERNANAPEVSNMEKVHTGHLKDGLTMVKSAALMKYLVVIRHHSATKHVDVPQKNQVCY